MGRSGALFVTDELVHFRAPLTPFLGRAIIKDGYLDPELGLIRVIIRVKLNVKRPEFTLILIFLLT